MASPISIYLSDRTLSMLDSLVAKQARIDKDQGLEGRQVTTRSKMVSRLIEEQFAGEEMLTIESIQYCVVDLAQSYGAEEVSLFGSFARGDNKADSDVDILLDKGEIKGMQVLDFQQDLAERLGRKVDVVTTAGANKRFLDRIEKDAIVLYRKGAA